MGHMCCACIAAIPLFCFVGWIVYTPAAALIVAGVSAIFEPFVAAGVIPGFTTQVYWVVGGLALINLLATERVFQFKLSVSAPKYCIAPCYGAEWCDAICNGFGLCSLYPFLLLLVLWLAVITAIFVGLAFIIVGYSMTLMGVLVSEGDEKGIYSAVEPFFEVVQEEITKLPISASFNFTSAELTLVEEKISASPESTSDFTAGGIKLVFGAAFLVLSQIIFLISYSVTYSASDAAKDAMKRFGPTESTTLLDKQPKP